jgi:hypothetical protein
MKQTDPHIIANTIELRSIDAFEITGIRKIGTKMSEGRNVVAAVLSADFGK